MALNEGFKTLAGNSEKWDSVIREAKKHPNFSDRELCAIQISQYGAGHREAELTETIFGFGVRIRSGLCADQVVFGGRALGRRVEKEEAIAEGIKWANEDPEHRSFIIWKTLQ